MIAFDPARDLDVLRALSRVADRLIAIDEGELARPAPSVSGWSAEQHIAHLALANELCLRNLVNLAKKSGLLVVEGGEMKTGARDLLSAGTLPRGVVQSPRMVRPPERIERALLVEWQRSNLAAIDAARADVTALAPSSFKIPHQTLGPLDAPEWARFAAVHTRHHLAIAYEVLHASGAVELEPLPGL